MAVLSTALRRAIGEQLRAARRQRGWTQKQLADEAAVGYKTIQRIEAADECVSEDMIEKAARPLELSFAAMLARAPSSRPGRPEPAYDPTAPTTLARTGIAGRPQASPWLVELVSRFARAAGPQPCCERLSASASVHARAELLELAPLLLDWPRHVLESPKWSSVDTPLANVPVLALDQVWIELDVRRSVSSAGFELPDSLDRRGDEQFAVAEAPEFVIDRLGTAAVVFGKPGSGKTSLLKWLMRELLRGEAGRYLLPLFVRLRDYARARRSRPELDILHFALGDVCRIRDAGQRSLWIANLGHLAGSGSDNVLILLDGWDELEPGERDALSDEIDKLNQGFAVIVTSRHTLPPRHLLPHTYFEIAELSPSASDDLIVRWFSALGRDWSANELRTYLARQPSLAQLARNPFTLTLLCAIAYQADPRQGLQLPTTRSAVYDRALELLVYEHRRRSNGPSLDAQRWRELETLALWLFQDADGAPRPVFDAGEVAAVTGDDELLSKVLEPARLACEVEGRWGDYHFVHTSYLEYFVARALAGRNMAELERRLLPNLLDVGWLQVTSFLVGQGSRALLGEIFETLLARVDRFGHVYIRAALLLAELDVSDGGQALLGFDVRDRLWAAIVRGGQVNAFRDAFAVLDLDDLVARTLIGCRSDDVVLAIRMRRMLRELPSERAVEQLVEDLGSDDARRASVATLGGARVFTTRDLARMRELAVDATLPIAHRERVLTLLGNLRDLAGLSVLDGLARQGPLRRAAIRSIGRIGGERAAAVLEVLLACTNNERESIYAALGDTRSSRGRRLLLEQLERCPIDHDDVGALLAALIEIPLSTRWAFTVVERHLRASTEVGLRALAASVFESASATGVGTALAEIARDDPEESVRCAALEALRAQPSPFHVGWLRERWRDTTRGVDECAAALAALLASVARFARTLDWAHLATDALADLELALAGSEGPIMLAALAGADAAGTRAVSLLERTIVEGRGSAEEACRTLARINSPSSAEVLFRLVAAHPGARDEDEATLDTQARAASEAARALSVCAPTRLLGLDSEAAAAALERYAIQTGSLVFDDHIIDPRGRRVT